jgi:hypothetical protein
MITISTTAVFFALFFVVILVYLMQKFGVETDLQKLSTAISRADDFHPQFRNIDFQEIFDAWKTLRTIDASDIELGARQIAHSLEDEVRPYLSMVPNKEAWSRFIQIQARIIEDLRSNGLKGVASRAVIFTESEAIPDILGFMKQFFILHPSLMLKGKAPELARINRQALLMAFQNLSTNFRNHSNIKKTSIEIIFSKSHFQFVAHQKLNLLELMNLKRSLFLKRGIYLPSEKRNRSKGLGIIYLALERLRATYTLELNARESVLIHDILVPFQDMLHESQPKVSSEKLAVFGQVSGPINVDFVTSNIKELELRNKELPFRKIFFSKPIPDEAWEWLLPGQVSEVLESEVEAVIREFRGDRK